MATQILSEETITTADLKAGLAAVQERDSELNFRAGKALDHLNHIPVQSVETKDKIVAAMHELAIPRLKDQHIHKSIDLMPHSVKELAVVLSGYTLSVNKDNQEKIMKVLMD